MILLHPYSTKDENRKEETWKFVNSLKYGYPYTFPDSWNYRFKSRNIDKPMDYPNLVKIFWGRDDLIILEDDKVPKASDLAELIQCPHVACFFPYPISFYFYTPPSLWETRFPYTLGFVKFSRQVQLDFPAETWYRPGQHWGLDGMIEKPIIAKYGPMHNHRRFIKHNHGRDPVSKLKGLKYQLSQMIMR